jgi:hypothetical protein
MSGDRIPFYLVQRMTSRDTGRPGFDGYFALDYMGSAEFEWGAIPDSLKAIRANRKIVTRKATAVRHGVSREVWFVGGAKDVEHAIAKLNEWLADERPHSKELSYFPEQVEGVAREWQTSIDAWWALRGNVMFALDERVAERLARAIGAKR